MNDQSTTTQSAEASTAVSAQVDAASAFSGTREEFLSYLVAALCDMGPAEDAAILRLEQQDAVQMAAIHPPLSNERVAPGWLSKAADLVPTVAESGVGQMAQMSGAQELYGQTANEYLIMLPVAMNAYKPEVAVFRIRANSMEMAVRVRERLELASRLMLVYDMQQSLTERTAATRRMRVAMEIVAQTNEHDRFKPAAMAICNEIAARWGCERVSLGVLRGRYIKLQAISHTDKFTRKMRLVQDIEAAMEECFDQDVEVIHPMPPKATFVNRTTAHLSSQHGPTSVVSIPLRHNENPKAVLLLERDLERPFTNEDMATFRLIGDLCAGPLLYLFENDRWIGAKIATDARRGAAALVGPKHSWIKLLVIAIFGFIAFATFVDGNYRVEAPFEIQSPDMRIIGAPFDGKLKEVYVKPGDEIVGGETVLAEFDTSELLIRRSGEESRHLEHLNELSKARQENKQADVLIAQARMAVAAENIRLFDHQINSARLIAPYDGIVLTGDLDKQINAQFQKGDVLFEIGPSDRFRAELLVPENRIGDVQAQLVKRAENAAALREELDGLSIEQLRQRADEIGLTPILPDEDKATLVKYLANPPLYGEMATAADPGEYLPFVIQSIDRVAEVVEGRNVFRVKAELFVDEQKAAELRRGMKGVAKINIDKRPFLTIWTQDLINWIRMQLWI